MPARKLFQLHLSTAIALMILASGLVWLNVRKTQTKGHQELKSFQGTSIGMSNYTWEKVSRGWPWEYHSHWTSTAKGEFTYKDLGSLFEMSADENGVLDSNYAGFAYNIIIGLAILAVAGVGL